MSATTPVPDDLSSVPPCGYLTELGWQEVSVGIRSRAIVAESQLRVAGAAESILALSVFMDEGRKAALTFVAHSLRETAQLLARVRRAEDAAARAQEQAEDLRRSRRKPRPPKAGKRAR